MTHKTTKARWCHDGTCHYDTYNINDQMVPSWYIYMKFTLTGVDHFCELYITNLTSVIDLWPSLCYIGITWHLMSFVSCWHTWYLMCCYNFFCRLHLALIDILGNLSKIRNKFSENISGNYNFPLVRQGGERSAPRAILVDSVSRGIWIVCITVELI